MTGPDLLALLGALRPWTDRLDFTDADWRGYIDAARAVQQADPAVVETVLDTFVEVCSSETITEYTSESKPFLLMRVVFDLPEAAPVRERRSFKGWINWPGPDTRGEVSLAWPITWRDGAPDLSASYEGCEGGPYDAAAEYRFLRATRPLRAL